MPTPAQHGGRPWGKPQVLTLSATLAEHALNLKNPCQPHRP